MALKPERACRGCLGRPRSPCRRPWLRRYLPDPKDQRPASSARTAERAPGCCPWLGPARKNRRPDARRSSSRNRSAPSHAGGRVAGGAGAHVDLVIIEGTRLPQLIIRAGPDLLIDIWKALLTKGAVVEPIIAAPAIDHGIHGHGHFERRMGIDQRGQSQKSIIGDAEHPHLAIDSGTFFTNQSMVS